MNRRSFLRLLGLTPVAAPLAAAGVAQAATAGFATGGVVSGGKFVFGEMATGSFIPLSVGSLGCNNPYGSVGMLVDYGIPDPRYIDDHPVIVRSYSDLLEHDAEPGTIAMVQDAGPIRPVITPPDEADRASAFRDAERRGDVEPAAAQ